MESTVLQASDYMISVLCEKLMQEYGYAHLLLSQLLLT